MLPRHCSSNAGGIPKRHLRHPQRRHSPRLQPPRGHQGTRLLRAPCQPVESLGQMVHLLPRLANRRIMTHPVPPYRGREKENYYCIIKTNQPIPSLVGRVRESLIHYDKLYFRQALSQRTIGFPTANIDYAAEKLLPPAGVYADRCRVAEQDYPTLVNIGTNPTVGNRSTTVEGYMLEVAGDVYGQRLCFR